MKIDLKIDELFCSAIMYVTELTQQVITTVYTVYYYCTYCVSCLNSCKCLIVHSLTHKSSGLSSCWTVIPLPKFNGAE